MGKFDLDHYIYGAWNNKTAQATWICDNARFLINLAILLQTPRN